MSSLRLGPCTVRTGTVVQRQQASNLQWIQKQHVNGEKRENTLQVLLCLTVSFGLSTHVLRFVLSFEG